MGRLQILLNKYSHIYNEEAIEVEFRHRMQDRILKYRNAEQMKEYMNIYEQLDSEKINEDEAIDRLIHLMEEYYGVSYLINAETKFSLQ